MSGIARFYCIAYRGILSLTSGRPMAGDSKGYIRDKFHSYRVSKVGHLQQILNEDILLPRGEVLLALGLLFHRASSASTMMECRVGDIAMMICKSTV